MELRPNSILAHLIVAIYIRFFLSSTDDKHTHPGDPSQPPMGLKPIGLAGARPSGVDAEHPSTSRLAKMNDLNYQRHQLTGMLTYSVRTLTLNCQRHQVTGKLTYSMRTLTANATRLQVQYVDKQYNNLHYQRYQVTGKLTYIMRSFAPLSVL